MPSPGPSGDPPCFGGYAPGLLGAIVALHADYYARHWSFGPAFEATVARELADFLDRHDPADDLFLAATDRAGLLGCVVVDRTVTGGGGAHLRWFIVAERGQGRGIGRELVSRAVAFCDSRNCDPLWLTTFRGLEAARRLYVAHGFRLVAERAVDRWQGGVQEQRYERRLPSAPPG